MADTQQPRDQEAADPARQDRREPVLRGLDPHAHLVRGRGEAAERRRHQLRAKGSSVSKGESLKDTAQTLAAMGADAVVIRHGASGAPRVLATSGWIDAGVVNAGDGTHEHPTQALLDAFTIRKRRYGDGQPRPRSRRGARSTIVGDILHSRVARSNVWLLAHARRRRHLVAPADAAAAGCLGVARARRLRPRRGDRRGAGRADDAAHPARADECGVLPHEREYARRWGLDARALAGARAPIGWSCIPGPMNRGLEISAAAADSPRSTVLDQVTNGVSMRMAVLYLVLAGERRRRTRRRRRDERDPPDHAVRTLRRRHDRRPASSRTA